MADAILALHDVSHVYDGRPVLRHVDLRLARGQCCLLLGANGAGKSTLLRAMAGLLRPTFGQVLAWGQPPDQVRARIGYMSHAPMLYDEFTGLENLRYFAALYGNDVCLQPEEALAHVGLAATLPQPVKAYSQGMRQRVSLARVLLPRPALLLLDEPFSNMDAESAARMLAVLGRARDAGTTIVLTTHQRALAEPLADTLLLLEEGALAGYEACANRPGGGAH